MKVCEIKKRQKPEEYFNDYIISAKEFNKLFYLCSKFKKNDEQKYPYRRIEVKSCVYALSFTSNLYFEDDNINIYLSHSYRFIEPISFEALCKLTYKDRRAND